MSVHTYIGARYVPRFVGTYDPTQIYEALDVVDNGSGTSYIARDIVPAGTPLTDTDHWFVYGASSGAIIQLQNDMIQAQNDITGLQGNVTTINGQLTTLDNRLDLLDERKIVMITDSYGNRTNSNGENIGDILIAKGYPIVYYNYISGGGFTKPSPLNPADYLSNYGGDHNKVTDVIFAMSANDNTGSLAAILTAMQTVYAATKAEYPNAKVHVIPWGVCMANTSWAEFLLKTTIKAYHQAAQYGYIIAENAEYMLRHTGLLDNTDLVHPNAAGVDYVAGQIAGYLSGNKIDVYHSTVGSLTPDAAISNYTGQAVTMYRHNGDVTITAGSAGGILGQFEHADNTMSLSINPCFTVAASVFSLPQSMGNSYFTLVGRSRLKNTNNLFPASVKFTIYDGFKIRVIIENLENTSGTSDRITTISNTVTISD